MILSFSSLLSVLLDGIVCAASAWVGVRSSCERHGSVSGQLQAKRTGQDKTGLQAVSGLNRETSSYTMPPTAALPKRIIKASILERYVFPSSRVDGLEHAPLSDWSIYDATAIARSCSLFENPGLTFGLLRLRGYRGTVTSTGNRTSSSRLPAWHLCYSTRRQSTLL